MKAPTSGRRPSRWSTSFRTARWAPRRDAQTIVYVPRRLLTLACHMRKPMRMIEEVTVWAGRRKVWRDPSLGEGDTGRANSPRTARLTGLDARLTGLDGAGRVSELGASARNFAEQSLQTSPSTVRTKITAGSWQTGQTAITRLSRPSSKGTAPTWRAVGKPAGC